MATIYEVSELAGVSLATVSRVMNNNAKVSDKTREKVLVAMKELGYRPNSIAQSLASNRSNSVGILVSELHGYFYGSILSGVETELRKAGKHVIIAAGHSNEKDEKDGIEFLIDRSCDTLVLHVEAVSDEYLTELNQGAHRIVIINRLVPALANNCICVDNEQGGYLAAKSLLDKGHRKIGYISGPLWKKDAQQRLLGHKRALKEFSVPFSEKLLREGDYMEGGGQDGLKSLLDSNQSFTALACANDETASGAMTAAREHNLAMPEQLSIVGFDNIIYAQYLYPKLSTVNYPVNRMARMAALWILKNVYQKENIKIQNLFDPEFVERDSIAQLTSD